ncbi:rhamnan synthesis F family protein [Streptococcus merionis]|uniref:RgpFc protein n=1 Tax=Streptococcus merionis TaxID=400065 RepID=A0A239SV90_9STRE|nr:rhamnan synthesis F family protein [Streptococcus merionis]SNU88654.1 RgpFc protein [Streptococcus merionis]
MKRLLLYIHFNKFNKVSPHVLYQLEKMRPLFEEVIVISNSLVSDEERSSDQLKRLSDRFLQRENKGYDFAAWRDGMAEVGFEQLAVYDSVTIMNDTCFGPLYDMAPIFHRFEQDATVDFWGMTNFRANKQFDEHIQSYFMSFKQHVIASATFQKFWKSVQDFTDVQDVIDNYETRVTTNLIGAGFQYGVVFDTLNEDASDMLHPDFSYYNPTAIISKQVPFIKVKAIDANQSIIPYILNEIGTKTDYPVELIVSYMSQISRPDFNYLLAHKYLSKENLPLPEDTKVAVHLHVFYTDLLTEFLEEFKAFKFSYDLFITTDNEDKKIEIEAIIADYKMSAQIFVTGTVGRDVLPMLKLKKQLSQYDIIGHFHTKKSKEADFWAGESWRKELIQMLVQPANQILSHITQKEDLGIVIADIPTFFRFNRIVNAWNEHQIAPEMNNLWEKMRLNKEIDFQTIDTFVMSYGTFCWFKYKALKPLFNLNLTDQDVPSEPLPQNSILHAIERLLIYIAWDQGYDFRISKNPVDLTPFIDNKLLNERQFAVPATAVDFTYMGGIKGAAKYIFTGPILAIKYIIRRLLHKIKL